jgi:hypothetical protein
MKAKSRDVEADDLRAEYDLAVLLKDGVQGKYAARYKEGTNLIPLAPDVAKAFPTAEAVNQALRLVIQLTRLSDPGKRTAAKA